MTTPQAEKVRFTVKDVDTWKIDFCRRNKDFCANRFTKASVERYSIELQYIAAHWEAARQYKWIGTVILEFEKPTKDPKNAPTKFDLMDELFRQMRLKALGSLRDKLKI
jgi:hypothetical protein